MYGEAEATESDSTFTVAFNVSLNPGEGLVGVSGAL